MGTPDYYDYIVQILADNFDVANGLFRDVLVKHQENLTSTTESTSQIPDGMVVVIGIVVVMSVLLVLTGIFYGFGFIMSRASKQKTAKKSKKSKEEKTGTAAPVAASAAPAPALAPVVEEGISGEVVAAIAAAVAMMAPEGKRYAVKSVSRASGGRPAWAAAGVADNTRPF